MPTVQQPIAGSGADSQARARLDALTTPLTASHTTAVLAANASETFQLALPSTFTLLSFSASSAARSLAYTTAAALAADAARVAGAVPADAVFNKLVFESFLPYKGDLVSPVGEDYTLLDGSLYMRVINTGASAVAVTVTLTYLPRVA